MRLLLLGVSLVTLVKNVKVDDTNLKTKSLHYRQNSDGLNIDTIINQWNRSMPINEKQTVTSKKEPDLDFNYDKIGNSFIDRFNFCLQKQKFTKSQEHQSVIVLCLKAELMTKLNDLLKTPNASLSLLNGYIELEKLKPNNRKKYSAKVQKPEVTTTNETEELFVPVPLKQSKIQKSHATEYYESYQKMLKELVSRKNGDTSTHSRTKRDNEINSRTLEKSAQLFAKGRKLISEITNNLENDEEDVEHLKQTITDPDLLGVLNNFTKKFSLRLNFYPGISARMTRNENSGVTFDLELDGISDEAGDEDDDLENETSNGSRQKKKGKKKIKPPKISKKTLKKLFPYLLIPFIIQAALLPIVLKFLLFIAIKALIAGKLALILVAFNAIRNASLKSDEDEYVERMSYDHYGYGNGEEYGAWVNRRTFRLKDKQKPSEPSSSPEEEEAEVESSVENDQYVDPYRYYRREE